jgi:hypothetical protein
LHPIHQLQTHTTSTAKSDSNRETNTSSPRLMPLLRHSFHARV